MIEKEIGIIDNAKIVYCQCLTLEEFNREGVSSYWKVNGKKITDPNKIREMIVKSFGEGSNKISQIITPNKIGDLRKRIIVEQRNTMINTLYDLRRQYESSGVPTASIDMQIEVIKKSGSNISDDGMVR